MQGTEITGICVCHNLSQNYDTMNDQKFVDVFHRAWHIFFLFILLNCITYYTKYISTTQSYIEYKPQNFLGLSTLSIPIAKVTTSLIILKLYHFFFL